MAYEGGLCSFYRKWSDRLGLIGAILGGWTSYSRDGKREGYELEEFGHQVGFLWLDRGFFTIWRGGIFYEKSCGQCRCIVGNCGGNGLGGFGEFRIDGIDGRAIWRGKGGEVHDFQIFPSLCCVKVLEERWEKRCDLGLIGWESDRKRDRLGNWLFGNWVDQFWEERYRRYCGCGCRDIEWKRMEWQLKCRVSDRSNVGRYDLKCCRWGCSKEDL